MSKIILALCLLFFVSSIPAQARERVMVVANLVDQSVTLSKGEIRNIFMGGVSDLHLSPVEITTGAHIRVIFNTRVIGLPESRIQSYWAQMKFSGRNQPPVSVESVEEMLRYLINNEASIGYLPESTEIPEGLTIVYVSN